VSLHFLPSLEVVLVVRVVTTRRLVALPQVSLVKQASLTLQLQVLWLLFTQVAQVLLVEMAVKSSVKLAVSEAHQHLPVTAEDLEPWTDLVLVAVAVVEPHQF
jgi:hypothetical protein